MMCLQITKCGIDLTRLKNGTGMIRCRFNVVEYATNAAMMQKTTRLTGVRMEQTLEAMV